VAIVLEDFERDRMRGRLPEESDTLPKRRYSTADK
jgi:hypothetical protein